MGVTPQDPRSEAFTELFNLYASRLRAYALRRTCSPVIADEVLAAAMEVAWRRFEDIPTDAVFGWLCGVAMRVARNDARGRWRYQRLIDAAVAEMEARPLVAYLDSGHLLADQREAVTTAFDRLDEADREILRLVAWEGLGGRQLAAALEVSEATARKRVSRARDRLRQVYAEASDQTEGGRQ